MKKLPQELAEAFDAWYQRSGDPERREAYRGVITKNHLSSLSQKDVVEFFTTFAREGGQIQGGGQRTVGRFRQMMESQYEDFRAFVLEPFGDGFDEIDWIRRTEGFSHFGIGLATIYLNRVDRNRYPVLNNKTRAAMTLLGVDLPAEHAKAYPVVRSAQRELQKQVPLIEDFFVADALIQFLVGVPEGIRLAGDLLGEGGYVSQQDVRYWLYSPGRGADNWDECLASGTMMLDTEELGNLLEYETKGDIGNAYMKARGLDRIPENDVLAAWEFSRVLKPGDIVIAKRGTTHYIGWGRVAGAYRYDASREEHRNLRDVTWIGTGEWMNTSKNIVPKRLTDVTKYPSYVRYMRDLIGIDAEGIGDSDEIPAGGVPLPLNLILYGPPGTGKTFALRHVFMEAFTERESTWSAEELATDMAQRYPWWQVITIVMLDLASAKVSQILEHPLMEAKIRLSSSQFPRAAVWNHLQSHTKLDCPHVKYDRRSEPLLFWKDEASIWSIDGEAAAEAVPELVEALTEYREQSPDPDRVLKRYEFTTFHQAYSYEDFVEGIKPIMSEDEAETLAYEIKPGIFRTMVQRALADPENDYALIIDEINRGNIASIFGELIALIEEDKRLGGGSELRVRLPYSRDEFVVPQNLYIIGAMNTADRSIEALDTALRRRFSFHPYPPKPELIPQPDDLEVDLGRLLTVLNERMEKLLDKDHCIGHSYFMGLADSSDPLTDLQIIFANKILPLLEEHFYGEPARIGMVLGERFVNRKAASSDWAKGDWGIDEVDARQIYELQDVHLLNADDFRSVYE